MSDLQMPSLDRLSLEWSLFKPNNGICAKVSFVLVYYNIIVCNFSGYMLSW